MSESVSAVASAPAASAPAAASSPSTATSGTTPAANGIGSPQAPGNQTSNPNQPATTQAEQRVLAEQDLDAYIEHKVNGQTQRIKVRDALKGFGLDKAANQKMEQAANERRQMQQLNHLFKTDFNKWCEVTGTDRDQFLRANLSQRKEIAEEILAKEYELQQMDPNQRKAMELEQQLKTMQSREMQQKQPLIDAIKEVVPADRLPKGLENATEAELKGFLQAKQQEFTQGVDQLSEEMLGAWEKVGLPKEKDFGSWMAQVMLDHDKRAAQHKKQTGEDLPPLQAEQAAVRVKERFLKSTQSLFSRMDAPAIQAALGEAIIQKLRDHDVGLASRQNDPNFGNNNRPGGSPPASEPKKQLNQIEWRKAMGYPGY